MPEGAKQRFDILCQITRAQHFAWRRAVTELCPEVDAAAVVDRMWEVTGEQTGAAYARRLDPDRPAAAQIAASIVWSSSCMGEDASLEVGDGEVAVVHADCPWFHWHKRLDLLGECRPGCDAWFASTIDHVNQAMGCHVAFETESSLPEGASCCRRRLWDCE